MAGIYGNSVLNEKVIFKNKIKEEILKDPEKAKSKIYYIIDDKKRENNYIDLIEIIFYVLAALLIAASEFAIIPSIIGLFIGLITYLIDTLNQKGKIVINSYSERKKYADKIYKNTIELLDSVNSKIIKETDENKKKMLCKQQKELENLKKYADDLLETVKSEEEYYEKYSFSFSNLQNAKEEIQKCINDYKEYYIYFDDIYLGYGLWQLYYFDIKFNDFHKSASNKNNTLFDGINYVDDQKLYDWMKDKQFYEVANDGNGDSIIYCINNKKFYYWDHKGGQYDGQISINNGTTFEQEKMKYKEFIKNNKEYVQADAELGYYRFSEPPKGKNRKEF